MRERSRKGQEAEKERERKWLKIKTKGVNIYDWKDLRKSKNLVCT